MGTFALNYPFTLLKQGQELLVASSSMFWEQQVTDPRCLVPSSAVVVKMNMGGGRRGVIR